MDKSKRKRWFFYGLLVLAGILLLGFGHHLQTTEEPIQSAVVREDPDRLVKIDLEGLTPERIEEVRGCLLAVRGVHSVEFGPDNQDVLVRFDIARTDLHRIRQALQAVGFTPYFH